MFDFYYGEPDEIRQQAGPFLLGLKRALPRWANSLPDSEFSLITQILEDHLPSTAPVMVETGVGASTLALVYFAMVRNGHVYSWDTNSSKASFVRSVCADAMEKITGKAISNHWTFLSSMSLSPYTGMPILRELTDRVDFSHHDSDHTFETVSGEVSAVVPLLTDGAIVCVDDANQTAVHTYEPIINMTRRKAGLPPIPPLDGNTGEPHFASIPRLLSETFTSVELLSTELAMRLEEDLYYRWYDLDRKRMGEVKMERFDSIAERFGAWQVSGRH